MALARAADSSAVITLRDVAQAARVSTSAVSQAINGTGNLHADTRERILEVVREMGYTPNRYAASLRRQQTMSVGFVATTIDDPAVQKRWANFYGKQLGSLVTAAAEQGYTVTVIPDTRPDLIGIARVDALYFPELHTSSVILDEARRRNLVVITSDAPIEDLRNINVDCGYGRATDIALDTLLAAGAQRIGLLTEEPDWSSDDQGEPAYRQWCSRHGLEPVVAIGDSGRTQLQAKVQELLDAGVDAIFSYYEEGPTILAEIQARGFRVPNEVQLVALCLDDCEENAKLGISRVCVHPERAPEGALKALAALQADGEFDPIDLVVDIGVGTTTR